MIKEFAQWLENETDLVIGTTLLLWLDDDSATNVSVVQIGGGSNDSYLGDREDVMVSIFTRNESFHAGLAIARSIREAIHRQFHVTLPVVDSDTYVMKACYCVTSPYHLGVGQRGLHEFTALYRVEIDKES